MAKKPVKKKAAPRKAATKGKSSAASRKPVKTAKRSTSTSKSKAKTTGLSALFRPVKQSVTIRLDSDVVSWFKKQAEKYQTEINSVLRKHMTKRG